MNARDAHDAIEEVRESGARKIALLIAVLAALLALVEMSGGNAEQHALKSNIDAANLWAFFQAKTIRQSLLERTSEMLELELDAVPPARKAAFEGRIAEWKATIARYESEPDNREGRKELIARARAAEAARDQALAADNMFDYGSAALQLAIVLASASVVIGVGALAWVAGGLGALGMLVAGLGWFAPTVLPF